MEDLTENTKNDIENLLDEYVVKKLDSSTKIVELKESIEDIENNLSEYHKKLSAKINNIDDGVSQTAEKIENSADDTIKELRNQSSDIKEKLLDREKEQNEFQESLITRLEEIEKTNSCILKGTKFNRILFTILISINLSLLGVLLFLFIIK